MLFKKYKEIKEEYLKRSPRGKWELVRNISIVLSDACGVSFLEPDFKITWVSYMPLIAYVDIILSTIYTFWYYSDTPLKALLITPTYAIILPSFYYYGLAFIPSSRMIMKSLLMFSGEKIYTDITPESNPNYIRRCNESAIDLLKSTIVTLTIFMASVGIYSCFPMYATIKENELQLPLPILFPFTDLKTMTGIVINMLSQFFINSIGITGTLSIEVVTSMKKNTIHALTIAIGHTINEFTDSITGNVSRSSAAFDYEFRQILIQIQDYDRYILCVSDIYYWKFFLQPFMLTFGVSLALFFYLHLVWVSGIGVAIFVYIQLYILCDIGNTVGSSKDTLIKKLHEMPWYLMSRQNQLDYAHILHRLQNDANLQMGPFSELNFDTFANMTNRIYTVLMTMIGFIAQ